MRFYKVANIKAGRHTQNTGKMVALGRDEIFNRMNEQ